MHSSQLGNAELCLKENSPVHSAKRKGKIYIKKKALKKATWVKKGKW